MITAKLMVTKFSFVSGPARRTPPNTSVYISHRRVYYYALVIYFINFIWHLPYTLDYSPVSIRVLSRIESHPCLELNARGCENFFNIFTPNVK